MLTQLVSRIRNRLTRSTTFYTITNKHQIDWHEAESVRRGYPKVEFDFTLSKVMIYKRTPFGTRNIVKHFKEKGVQLQQLLPN